jgi:hypothetical protein
MKRRLIALCVLALSCTAACAGAPHAGPAGAHRNQPRDVHGEPLALLPPGALVWARMDVATARSSPHWSTLYELAQRNGGDFLRTLDRELGFNPFERAQLAAFALYAPPGGVSNAAHGWPALYVRGAIDRDGILAAARARAAADDPPTLRTVEGVSFVATRERAYLFPATDVVIVFDPALTRRVLHQLSGEEPHSVADDSHFADLWTQAGGNSGTLRMAGDVTALRSTGLVTAGDDTGALESFVARADGTGSIELHIAGLATSEQGARQVVARVDEVRESLLGRLEVRFLGLSRLLNQGVTAVQEGRLVRMSVDARSDEVSRVLRAAQFLQQFAQ